MKKLPIGIQNFREIIEGDYLYVDKTQCVYNLIDDIKYNFLSRPKGFGKSLLIDTIAEVFGGDRELFRGLWIYDSGYGFAKHPVIRLDMSEIANETEEILEKSLMERLGAIYFAEGLERKGETAHSAFMRLIMLLHAKYNKRVVVLIDDYDKPILDHIDDFETAAKNRPLLLDFYGLLKSMDAHLHFMLITGMTRFTNATVFASGLNNLYDLTMSRKSAGLCGIPENSLCEHFGEYLEGLGRDEAFCQHENMADEIAAWYGGYSWDGKTRLLNPYSLLNFFAEGKFKEYWQAANLPKFFIEEAKRRPKSFSELNDFAVSDRLLNIYEIERLEIEPFLFHTGYLTVKKVERTRGPDTCILDIPNREVREAFGRQVVAALGM